jgi:nitronate monooxygenase
LLPRIIQGGMGVGVSGWRLARAVAQEGQLGVVSGTALAVLLARLLQQGDPGGHMRYALEHFPFPQIAQRALAQHYIAGGKAPDAPYRLSPLPSQRPPRSEIELTVLGNFAEVFLAKQGHRGRIGINYLEKIQFPTLPSLYGAMLAGVDYVLMGAGIPRTIPGILDGLAIGQAVRLKLDVSNTRPGEEFFLEFDPADFVQGRPPILARPDFLAIVSSATLAMTLARKANGKVNGFIIEGSTAGGHNAPPRGAMTLNALGEPVYGPRDQPDLEKIRELGLPFWMAGSYAHSHGLEEALETGAVGIQVGTAFAFCEESGIEPSLKQTVIDQCLAGASRVFTDPVASPTGFPFKVVQLDETIASASVYEARSRICDLGYLRHPYRKEDGTVGYRCPAEPVEDYLRKGGAIEETIGRKCVCNGLLATMGLGQVFDLNQGEKPLVTAGDDLVHLKRFLKPGARSYRAADVIEFLLNPASAASQDRSPANQLDSIPR